VITHLSASQLGMFQRCGEQWRRRYLEGEVIPPGIAARIGTGVHKAAEKNFRYKMESGEDMRLDEVQDAAATAYDKALAQGVFISPDEAPGAKLAMAEGKDTAVSLATLFRRELAPAIQPRLVEHKVTLDLPGLELPVVTVLDCYTEDKALRDMKTSGKKWSEDKAHTSPQPTLYRESVKEATGEYPEKLLFDVLVSTKTPALQTITTSRTEDDLAILVRQFGIMTASIQAGIFQPAERDSWMCSMKWCGYFFTCPHIPAHRKILPKRSA
jgi:hypothetical protein